MANGENTAAIVGRMKEPSTWAGLSALMMLFGLNVEEAAAVANVGAGLAGVAALFMRESR